MSSDDLRQEDAAARIIAQTIFDRPVVLEAGAGTGKTAALVARILVWSLGPGWELAKTVPGIQDEDAEQIAGRVFDGVVAITFTEDAAAEMTRRVAQSLHILEGKTVPKGRNLADVDNDIPGLSRAEIPENPSVVIERAGALLKVLERLRTSTIHAFSRSLLARFPVESGIHPSFEVDADGTAVGECIERAVEEVLGEGYRRSEESFMNETLTADVMVLAERRVGPANVRKAAEKLVGAGVASDVLIADPLGPEVIYSVLEELFQNLSDAEPLIVSLVALGKSSKRSSAAAQLLLDIAGLGRPLAVDEAFTGLTHIGDWLETQSELGLNLERVRAWSKKVFSGAGETKAFQGATEGQIIALKHAAMNIGWVSGTDIEAFGALRRVLHRVLVRVVEEKRRVGILGFRNLLVDAHRLLADNSGVRKILRAEIRQLLVDEMQDTDQEQAAIVELLAFGDGEGPGLFLVGDPKQAIYSWRQAEMAVYQRLVRKVQRSGGIVCSLTVNFRSVQPVLDEVERIAARVMKPEEDVQPRFQPLLGRSDEAISTEYCGFRTAVEHWFSAESGDEGLPAKTHAGRASALEAEAVARDAAALMAAGTAPEEMAILMRTRSHQAVYLDALRRYGVPYAVGSDPNFYRTREVIEIMALVRSILDPLDLTALAAVLRSPFVGVPDVALRPLWRAGLPECVSHLGFEDSGPEVRKVIDEAVTGVDGLALEDEGLDCLTRWPEALQAFLEKLTFLRRTFANEAPDTFIERLRMLMAVEPLAACRFPGAYRLANVDRFFRDLEDMLADGASADAVLRRLRRAERERPDEAGGRPRSDSRGVNVLTIHGAKGLGFEYLWLVQTHAVSSGPRSEPLTEVAGVKDSDRWQMSLRGWTTPGFAAVEMARKRTEEAERVRLLYVALTRAKKRLVTVGNPLPTGGANGSFLNLFKSRSEMWPKAEEIWSSQDVSDHWHDQDEARWVWLGHPEWETRTSRAEIEKPESKMVDPSKVEADADWLERRAEEAQAHQGRPWLGTASEEAHRLFREAIAERLEGAEDETENPFVGGTRQRVATAVGTAVHSVLERFDHGAEDPAEELRARVAEAFVWLDGALVHEEIKENARTRLSFLIEQFQEGQLWQRFLALDGSILARELPLIASPEYGESVGAVTGSIDLVYRDCDTGEFVVADYKTDRVTDEHQMRERALLYRPQLQIYARALEAAMGLDVTPRQELWFVDSGVVTDLSEI